MKPDENYFKRCESGPIGEFLEKQTTSVTHEQAPHEPSASIEPANIESASIEPADGEDGEEEDYIGATDDNLI